MINSDYGFVRRIAAFILNTLRTKDLPSLRSDVQSQITNVSTALAAPKYIVQEPSTILTNEQALSTLSTGYMKVTTTTGVVSSQVVPIPATDGGTGQTSYAVGDLLYASTTTVLSKLADVATGNALISGGVNTAPSWGKVGLTTHISGILDPANGGTGVNNGTNAATFPATGTTAMRGVANTFTKQQTFDVGVVIKQSLAAGEAITIGSGYCMVISDNYQADGDLTVDGTLTIVG